MLNDHHAKLPQHRSGAMDILSRLTDISPAARIVYMIGLSYGNDRGERIFPGIPRLHTESGLSRNTTRRCIRELVAAGLWIEVGERNIGRGGGYVQEFRAPPEALLSRPRATYEPSREVESDSDQRGSTLEVTSPFDGPIVEAPSHEVRGQFLTREGSKVDPELPTIELPSVANATGRHAGVVEVTSPFDPRLVSQVMLVSGIDEAKARTVIGKMVERSDWRCAIDIISAAVGQVRAGEIDAGDHSPAEMIHAAHIAGGCLPAQTSPASSLVH